MTRPNRLPLPDRLDAELLLEEHVWGHRLYDEQTPWLTLLEFLMILSAEDTEGRALKEPRGPNTLEYRPSRRLHLRNVLFNNPSIQLVRDGYSTSEDRWQAWLERMKKEAAGLQGATREFSYLRERFSDFDQFCDIVGLFRSSAIEGESNKRWSSKFVFPFGPDCLYEDLRVGENTASNDRRFFARTGELLYLMLCRSGQGENVASKLRGLILNPLADWNRLAKLLQPDTREAARDPGSPCYLPYQDLPDFKELARDWLRLLDLKMPRYDVLPHLATMAGLHLLLYVLRRASEWAKSARGGVVLVLEIVASDRNLVRQAAIEQYDYNNYLPREAIEGYLASIWESRPIQMALKGHAPYEHTKKALQEALGIHEKQWNKWQSKGVLSGTSDPEKLFHELVQHCQKRHRHHFANIHREYGREIGLISRRGTKKLRYAPSDSFLKTLVYTLVSGRMELGEFLRKAYSDYRFVIGDAEAKEALR